MHLNGATVEGGVYLNEATVKGGVHLNGATVKGGVYLNEATVEGGVHLNGATVEGGVIDSAAPNIPDLDRCILTAINATPGGKLEQAAWHTCETAHCRAGWAVIVAGTAGAALEKRLGTPAAAAALYTASGLAVPDFYDTNNARVLSSIRARSNKLQV